MTTKGCYSCMFVILLFVGMYIHLAITVKHLIRSQEREQPGEYLTKNISIAYYLGGKTWTRLWFLTHLKTLISYTSEALDLHLIVTSDAINDYETLLKTWNLTRVTFTLYDLDPFLKKVSWIPTEHYAGVYGLAKILLPDIIHKSVKKVILMDTDILLKTDIMELWRNFHRFTAKTIFAASENLSLYYLNTQAKRFVWPAFGKGYNTGVVLIDLEKLRNSTNWNALWRKATEEQLRIHGPAILADQDIFNSVFLQNPSWVLKLGCGYNYQIGITASPHKFCLNEPKLVHFNSKTKAVVPLLSEEYTNLRCHMEHLNGDMLKFTRNGMKPEPKSLLESSFCGTFIPHKHFRVFPNVLGSSNGSNRLGLVVQLSADRLNNIIRSLKYWKYPVSAAVYGTDEELYNVVKSIEQLNRTDIALHLVFKPTRTYPINFLRNVAIQYSKSLKIVLTDADFLIFGDLQQLEEASSQLQEKEIIVIPAFELTEDTYDMDKAIFPKDKNDVKRMLENKKIRIFRENIWPAAHRATKVEEWLYANESYTIEWKKNYEPYIIINRQSVPHYDERFGGFGWNKVTHIIKLRAENYTFKVTPTSFMLHQSHPPSNDLLHFRTNLKYRQCLQELKRLFIDETTAKLNAA
ncbi:unnamed protein product [Caenorhabditis bovis]|uniref:Glycosyltransferase-like protein LARGE2 n=1 Tax=Caenorhabditis bovis TaxID=2654633 RepID=A0A8S1EL92_9PELO|nr:unnamed protein product [Caenorhabditis bovis]